MSDHASTPTIPPGSLWDFWHDFWPDERSGDGLPHGDGGPKDGEDWPEEKPAA